MDQSSKKDIRQFTIKIHEFPTTRPQGRKEENQSSNSKLIKLKKMWKYFIAC